MTLPGAVGTRFVIGPEGGLPLDALLVLGEDLSLRLIVPKERVPLSTEIFPLIFNALMD